MDEAVIHQDEKFDGYYGIQTSELSMKPEDILAAYHTLWKIEESLKSDQSSTGQRNG